MSSLFEHSIEDTFSRSSHAPKCCSSFIHASQCNSATQEHTAKICEASKPKAVYSNNFCKKKHVLNCLHATPYEIWRRRRARKGWGARAAFIASLRCGSSSICRAAPWNLMRGLQTMSETVALWHVYLHWGGFRDQGSMYVNSHGMSIRCLSETKPTSFVQSLWSFQTTTST